jgi:hypothetical protein
LSTKKLEDSRSKVPLAVVELLLPIDVYWQLDEMLKRVEYLQSAGEDATVVGEAVKQVYLRAARYAVAEKDRLSLQGRGHDE